MDNLSSEIKDKLNQFKSKNPGGSSPYFVSQLAADYAKENENLPPTPPPKKKIRKKR
jgi:hypothetical protein